MAQTRKKTTTKNVKAETTNLTAEEQITKNGDTVDVETKTVNKEEELIKKIAELEKKLSEAKENQQTKTIQIAPEEKVTVLYIGGMAKGCSVKLGKLGRINRDGGFLEIPKKEFLYGINECIELLLTERKLIVVNGLTDEERERYNVLYAKDELLTLQQYQKLLDFDKKEICDIYRVLCKEHKEMVVTAFYSAYDSGDKRVTIEKCKALNEIAKEQTGQPMFKYLLEYMGSTLSE